MKENELLTIWLFLHKKAFIELEPKEFLFPSLKGWPSSMILKKGYSFHVQMNPKDLLAKFENSFKFLNFL